MTTDNLDNTEYKRNFIDQSSGSQIQLTNIHGHIHRGTAYKTSQVKLALANDGFTYYEIITPTNKDIHLKSIGIFINDGPVILKLMERPTLTTGTTAIVPVNKNRTRVSGSPLTSGATIKSDPTGISGGGELENLKLGSSGVGAIEEPMLVALGDEWVLEKGGNAYLLSIQNKNGSAIDMSSRILWYE